MPRRTLWILTALVLAVHWLVLQGVPLASGRLCCASRQGVHHPQRGSAAACGSGSPRAITQPCRRATCRLRRPSPPNRARLRPCALPPQNPPPHRASPLTWPRQSRRRPSRRATQNRGRTAPPLRLPKRLRQRLPQRWQRHQRRLPAPAPIAHGRWFGRRHHPHRAAPWAGHQHRRAPRAPACAHQAGV